MDGLSIGGSHPCFIIAEIGQNHQGDMQTAKELIMLAKECGANCVKFQKSSLPDKFTKDSLETPYDSENSFGKTYGEHKAKLELSKEEYIELQKFAEKDIGILFTASAMDIPSANFLIELKVPFIKIGSGDTNNFMLIECVAKSGIPIVLSTGMQDFSTVQESVRLIRKYHNKLAILQCVSSYPTAPEDVNLLVMDLYRRKFGEIVIGYSGHELGIFISIAAVARGAKVLERHFTKDNNLQGTDHKCSLNPEDFKTMVKAIRDVELALGVSTKKFLHCETPCHEKLGKSLVSTRILEQGETLKSEDIAVKVSQPHGVSPQDITTVLNKVVKQVIQNDSPICYHNLE